MERQHFEFTIDDEQRMPTREEVIEIEKRLLRWARNDAAFHSAIVCEEQLKFEKKYAHWKELEKAEAEGRLVVLPCKVGATVYITEPRFYNYERHEGVQKGICEGYTMHDEFGWVVKVSLEKGEPHTLYYYNFTKFGKTVFLTREEAEAALEGESNG